VVENDGFVFEVPEDCYLMLGDNRNESLDARYWADEAYEEGLVGSPEEGQSYTYVKREKILSKAMFTYWPHFEFLSDYEE
jgi:signal peptidase I